MTQGNKKKASQLGVSFGKAANRLRKLVMFRLIQKTGEDMCFRCGEQIEAVADLSLEHRMPWLDSTDPVGLFFDLENVTFSHISCNSGARKNGTFVTRRRGDGKLRCSHCHNWKAEDAFTIDRRDVTGRACECRQCMKAGGWHHRSRTRISQEKIAL